MKLAKRVLAALLAAVVTASCIAMTASAVEAPIDVGNVEEVLEYYMCEDYRTEDFENLISGVGKTVAVERNCTKCGEQLIVLRRDAKICSNEPKSNPYYHCPNPECTFTPTMVKSLETAAKYEFPSSATVCIHTDGTNGVDRDNLCDKCGFIICMHKDVGADGTCDICDLLICKHENLDKKSKCTSCGAYWHTFNTSGSCTCGFTKTKAACSHDVINTDISNTNYGQCTVCLTVVCSHVDNNNDGICDNAGCALKLPTRSYLSNDPTIVDDNGNSVLKIVDTSGDATKLTYSIAKYNEENGKWETRQPGSLVISLRVKLDNYVFYDPRTGSGSVNNDLFLPENYVPVDVPNHGEPEILNNGAVMQIGLSGIKSKITKGDTVIPTNVYPFAEINCTDTFLFQYLDYDETDAKLKDSIDSSNLTAIDGAQAAKSEWYTVSLVLNFEESKYEVSYLRESTDEVITSGVQNLGNVASASNVVITLPKNTGYAGTTTYFDDISIYEGTYTRDPEKKVDYATNQIIKLAAYLNDENVSAEDKLRIADVFDLLFNGDEGVPYYTVADAAPDKKEEIAKIISDSQGTLINATYEAAFLSYTNALSEQRGYYARKAYCENVLSRFITIFDFTGFESDDDKMAAFPGITNLEAIKNAKQKYQEELTALEKIKKDSEDFVKAVADLDSTSRDYSYLSEQYEKIKVYEARDLEYEYALGDFATVADANVVFENLESKIQVISADAKAFVESAATMKTSESFKAVYDAYVIAKEIYGEDGVINENIDNSTYEGLVDAIADYLSCIDEIVFKAEQTEQFIKAVENAKLSSYYITMRDAIKEAYKYIDEDKANLNAELEYYGAQEAKDAYDELAKKLENDENNADKYIAAVNAIGTLTEFAERKAAVENALTLKVNGNILGYAGVSEANVALAEAETAIKELEGYAKTLVNAVEDIAKSSTLTDRRAYILIANSCLEKADETDNTVKQATEKLNTLIAAYDKDIKAVNDAFLTILKNAGAMSSVTAPSEGAYKNADVIENVTK